MQRTCAYLFMCFAQMCCFSYSPTCGVSVVKIVYVILVSAFFGGGMETIKEGNLWELIKGYFKETRCEFFCPFCLHNKRF